MTALRQRMLEDMQIRNLSPHTQRAYVENVARFARYFGRSPAELGPDEIRTYQVYLTRQRKLAPSSLEIAVCALRFLAEDVGKELDLVLDAILRALSHRQSATPPATPLNFVRRGRT